MSRYLLLLCVMLGFQSASIAQVTIHGKIFSDSDNEPLVGANVVIKGTTTGDVTDWDGSFSFETDRKLPLMLKASFVGYESKVIEYTHEHAIKIYLAESTVTLSNVEVKGKRISEKEQSAPLTVETLDALAIKETASPNFYDGLGALKGVDLTTASLGFKVINTRGFNSTSPVRTLQLIDGVDNQAPGLNFSLGNFLGCPNLDVLKVDLIQGASSAFYGPNAFNGVISIHTKNPFLHKGLDVQLKTGEREMFNAAFRYADALTNSDGDAWMAYKINGYYLDANDWHANNYQPIDDSRVEASNPGGYDAVNIYGDEYYPLNDKSNSQLWQDPGLGTWYRTGYREVDLVDYDTKNFKSNLALHFRTKPGKGVRSPEIILASNFGSGNTVYQGENRYNLKNIIFHQHRIEYRKKDKFHLRFYTTQEDAGDSYDPYFTALLLQERGKSDEAWSADYLTYWRQNIAPRFKEMGYPQLMWDPQKGELVFDSEAARNWLDNHYNDLVRWHDQAETAANEGTNIGGTSDFLEPGTPEFEEAFEEITTSKSNNLEEGTKFYDRSDLYHLQGEYIFEPKWTKSLTVGGNARLYTPNSDGTIFIDTMGREITNFEFGVYGGIDKKFFDDALTASATVRIDKNKNYDFLVSPAASLVWQPSENDYLRFSFSSAIRNPTLTDQYLNLDVGRATLKGNLHGADSLITSSSFVDYLDSLKTDKLDYFNLDPIRPEKVKTIELGYRSTWWDQLYVDASIYYNFYRDFIGYQIGLRSGFQEVTGLPENTEIYRFSSNSESQVQTQGFAIGLNYFFARYFTLKGNYNFNRLVKTDEDDPIIPAFNTPEHKFNIGFSGRNIDFSIGDWTIENVGFNIQYKWVDGFRFEGSPQFTGFIPSYDLLDAQINYTAEAWHTTFKLGASNLLDNEHYETYGGPEIGRLAYFSILYSHSFN